jgi:hypothetical protein
MTSALRRLRGLLARNPRLTAIAAVVLAGAIALVVALAGRGEPEETATAPSTTSTTTTTAPTTTTTTEPPPPVAPLTGLSGDFGGRLDRPALVVKIDNVERARPQAGLNQADIVFEEPVEGNLTRLAAVFHSTDADPVGPVRSVRTTDLEIVSLFGRPLFASSGGNAGVVPQLHAANVVDIGANVSNQGFYRSGMRPAPHNLITSTPGLYGKAPELPPPPKPIFSYLRRGDRHPPGSPAVGGVALRFGGPEVSRFTWDRASRTWLRSQRGRPHLDARGVRVAPENVLVMEITYDRSGQRGRSVPHGEVTGKGRVWALVGGQAVEGTWRRPGLGDPLELEALDGSEIRLNPGQTFVELTTPGGWSFI